MTALLTRPTGTPTGGDMFCGWGGSSGGIKKAGLEIDFAVNHNDMAIECHNRNFPEVNHYVADLSDIHSPRFIDPADLPYVAYLWASPSCKDHSQANAKKLYDHGPQAQMFPDWEDDDAAYAASERSRVTMCCPLRYANRHRPELAVIENVPLAAKWGPNKNGSTFRWWLNEWRTLGYDYRVLFLNSMFFPPTPQSRDRMYVALWRRGNTPPDLDFRPTAYCTSDRCGGQLVGAVQTWKTRGKTWPLEQWGCYGLKRGQYYYACPDCQAPVEPAAFPAYSCIDWSDLGPMIGERAEHGLPPLVDNTLARISRAMVRFSGSPPIILPTKSVWGVDRTANQPLCTQTTQQVAALSTLIKNNGGADEVGYRGAPITGPIGSVTTSDSQAVATTLLNGQTNDSARNPAEPLFAVRAERGANCMATEGVVVPNAGNTFEHPGQTRGRPLTAPLFTQHQTQAFGFAHVPSLIEMRGGGSSERPVTSPAHTITAGGHHHGLVSPGLFTKLNGGPDDTAWHSTDDPLNTITTRDVHGLVLLPWLDHFNSDPALVTEQLATVMTHMRHALASIEPGQLTALSWDDLMKVRFRMLKPQPELQLGMGFELEYELIGSNTQMTSGLGNAVTPPVATAITARMIVTLDDPFRLAA